MLYKEEKKILETELLVITAKHIASYTLICLQNSKSYTGLCCLKKSKKSNTTHPELLSPHQVILSSDAHSGVCTSMLNAFEL